MAVLRNRQFLSLTELNQAIRANLEAFNRKPFQKREGSRASCFTEEKLFLLPLPTTPFELAVWKVATVQYNYYISVERMNYSVPYEYIKQQVDDTLPGPPWKSSLQGLASPPICGSMAVPTSTTRWRSICRRTTGPTCSGRASVFSAGRG